VLDDLRARQRAQVCGSRCSYGDVHPGRRRTRVAGASGLDLEGVPLRLPRIGRHAPTEGKGVIHLGRDYLTGVGHETGHVVIAKPRLLNDKPALLGELDPNCPLWRVLHQDYQAVVWLFGADHVCRRDVASRAVELNRRYNLAVPGGNPLARLRAAQWSLPAPFGRSSRRNAWPHYASDLPVEQEFHQWAASAIHRDSTEYLAYQHVLCRIVAVPDGACRPAAWARSSKSGTEVERVSLVNIGRTA